MQRFAEGHLPPRLHPTGPGMPDAAAPLTQGAKATPGRPGGSLPTFPGPLAEQQLQQLQQQARDRREDEGAPRAQAPQSPRLPRPGVPGARGPAP